MKRLFVILLGGLFLFSANISVAGEAKVFNMLGTWKVRSVAMKIVKGRENPQSHHNEGQSTISATATITKQEGQHFWGEFKSQKYTEKFACVVSHDNKTIHCIDEDGAFNGEIISKDKIKVTYSHVSSGESVVASSEWTRMK